LQAFKNPTATTTNDLNNPVTEQMVQLDAAIHMELWQEGFKAVEDILGLMSHAR
jgi:hypothetical protein